MPDDNLTPVFDLAGPVTPERLAEELPRLVAAVAPARVRGQRWFGSKAREIVRLELRDGAVFARQPISLLAIVAVRLDGGDEELYHLPLAARPAEEAAGYVGEHPEAAFLQLATPDGSWLVYDALADSDFSRGLFRRIVAGETLEAERGAYLFQRTGVLEASTVPGKVKRLRAEQSNTSIVFDDRFILKAFRKLSEGINPDLEIARFLTTKTDFRQTPLLAGQIEYRQGEWTTAVGALQTFVPNSGDGWQYTLAHLREFFAAARGWPAARSPAGPSEAQRRTAVADWGSSYLPAARRLGEVTGQLHRALASDGDDPAFAPEPVGREDLEGWVDGLCAHARAVLRGAEGAAAGYPEPIRADLGWLVARADLVCQRLGGLRTLAGARVAKTRHHGDYHLGQVLRAGDDFVVLDFEGEPARPLAERRAKHLALRDVAGMLRSFNYAVNTALAEAVAAGEPAHLEELGRDWESAVAREYLAGYEAQTLAKGVEFLPESPELLRQAIEVFTLEKAVYELGYEVNNRPDWLPIPLRYLREALSA